jgi:transposase
MISDKQEIRKLKTRISKLEIENQFLKLENLELKRNLAKVLRINEELRKDNLHLKKQVKTLTKRVKYLEKELERHRVKPNQPSGSKPDYEKENSQSTSKPGQKAGHKGVSRLSPTNINKEIEYKVNCCEHCKSTNLVDFRERSKIITDIEFQVINTKEYYFDMKCQNCGKVTKAQSLHGNSQSPFGKGVQTFLAYLSSVCGATKRPIENLFKDFFGLEISDTSLINSEIRNSKELIVEYNKHLDYVKQAKFSHKDETTYRVGGKTNWIWVYDSKDYVFYRLAETRSKQTVIDDFGKNCKQISINDCYNAYNDFEFQQICWAHLLRETEAHATKENASFEEKKFFRELRLIYKEAKSFLVKDPPYNDRQQKRVFLENELCKLMNSLYNKSEFLTRICNRLNDRLMHCFLFVEVEGLPSTNNQAERSLRPFVIHRKASFGSKSYDGGQAKVIFKTMFENAKRQKKQLVFALNSLFQPSNYQIR